MQMMVIFIVCAPAREWRLPNCAGEPCSPTQAGKHPSCSGPNPVRRCCDQHPFVFQAPRTFSPDALLSWLSIQMCITQKLKSTSHDSCEISRVGDTMCLGQ